MKSESQPAWSRPTRSPSRRDVSLVELYGHLAAAADGDRELVDAIDYGLKTIEHDKHRRASKPAAQAAPRLH